MKVAAIIAEYNPFHNGHFYQINTIRESLGADYVIVAMSGDFVQRGIPALLDKYIRCEMAISCGADIVFEIPSYFALGSAEYFATGAVSLIDKLGVVDILHFGSECGDIDMLYKCADIVANESQEFKYALNHYLKQGNSYPLSRQLAIKDVAGIANIDMVFESPNNILGVEYIKALMRRHSKIKPLTIKRSGQGYNCAAVSHDSFSSAFGLRSALEKGDMAVGSLASHMPIAAFEVIAKYQTSGNCFMYPDDFSQVLLYKLLDVGMSKDDFSDFYDVGGNLSNTIYNNMMGFDSFNGFALLCKSKNITYTRICRSLIHILLDMSQSDANFIKNNDSSPYARLLGFSKNGRTLLKSIKSNAAIPIVTKPIDSLKVLNKAGVKSLKMDIHAANIYEGIKASKIRLNNPDSTYKIKNEFTREIIIES